MSDGRSAEAMLQDGKIVIGARCRDCEWLLGTDTPESWDIVEQMRLTHENETGHQTTVEVTRQRTILAGEFDGMEMSDYLRETVAAGQSEWICPECEQTAKALDATQRCPDCGVPFHEVFP